MYVIKRLLPHPHPTPSPAAYIQGEERRFLPCICPLR